MNKESMMDKYDVTLYGVDSYTGYPTALTYRLEASSVGIAVDLARLAVNGNYPEFVEDYELYKERMGAKCAPPPKRERSGVRPTASA